MAALLKKRALAEYSQVIQEEPRPLKKLRLIQKAPPPEVFLDLQAAQSSNDALLILLKFEEELPVDCDSIPGVVRELLEHYQKEKEAAVRCKVAGLLGNLARTPGFNSDGFADDILALLKNEKSSKAVSQLFNALMCVGKSLPGNTSLHAQLVDSAKQYLSKSSHLVRSSCLQLIGALGTVDHKVEEKGTDHRISPLVKILGDFTQDQDSRVRTNAFQAMLEFHQRGIQLNVSVYEQSCQALTDDYESVRRTAVKLIWVLCHLYPESLIPAPNSAEDLRLVDDGFVKICTMVNDLSMKVRVQAASLLASLHLVSPRYLEQTLDKKLMSNMRKKVSAHERAKEHFKRGEWSTGQKWADDKPTEEINPENVSLMNIGACGAFVHGLEDEYLEVRNAALDSLCELAAQSHTFAHLVQDSMIDMFNDEIESVRLNAINSLRKIGHHIVLREDQLDIILGVLQDFSFTTREEFREMLCGMRLATKECLNSCVMALLDNLRRYPQDRLSIWKCMKFLGRNQPDIVLPILPDLLGIHPYFDTPQPDMDDPAYIGVLVLVFNAAVDKPTVVSMFQDHIWRHYSYLRDSLSDLVPVISGGLSSVHTPVQSTQVTSDAERFLQQSVQRLENLDAQDTSTTQQLLKVTVRDLQRISELEPRLSSSADCVCMFLHCQELLLKLTSSDRHMLTLDASNTGPVPIVEKILSLTIQLQRLFLGLDNVKLGLIRQTQLKALVIHLSSALSKSNIDGGTKLQMSEAFLVYLAQLQSFLQSNEITGDAFTTSIFSELPNMDASKPFSLTKILQQACTLVKPCTFPLKNRIRKSTVVIHEPTGTSDNPIKFTAGLMIHIPVDATIENVRDLENLRLQVRYPDLTTQLILPKSSDLRKLSPLSCRLVTQVVLSHSLWSEPSHVELSVVLKCPDDASLETLTENSSSNLQIVPMCKPIKILISPRPAKR